MSPKPYLRAQILDSSCSNSLSSFVHSVFVTVVLTVIVSVALYHMSVHCVGSFCGYVSFASCRLVRLASIYWAHVTCTVLERPDRTISLYLFEMMQTTEETNERDGTNFIPLYLRHPPSASAEVKRRILSPAGTSLKVLVLGRNLISQSCSWLRLFHLRLSQPCYVNQTIWNEQSERPKRTVRTLYH